MRVAVIGGAGFIGSHLVDSLVQESHEVLVIDNLSSGKKENINSGATFIEGDIRKDLSADLQNTDTVFHLAADPDVRFSSKTPEKTFDINVRGTFMLLESCRKADVSRFLFSSSSTVYGDAKTPTPETAPCNPISHYGASKLAGEAYLSTYCSNYGMKGTSLRYANIFGERNNHGVMYDFYNKLKSDPTKLEILGDGKQSKSYLHISDCVSANLIVLEKQEKLYDVFNVGVLEQQTVNDIAQLECQFLGLSPSITYAGAGQAWKGDVKNMLLDSSKLETLGWEAETDFKAGLKKYIMALK
ncbi:NAD-dependent epimerase/dehydratase family protein [Candidatus Micrarchaeota archaeon]|nr:NAD-dependent epimerase/dehydratase family protein [Candidatus Micrarchaeota archaeon]